MSEAVNKPVIFLAFANDRDDTIGYLRNLPDEARRLREVLERAEQAALCEVVVRSNCTSADIFKVFQDPKYRNRIAIFHYGGHANGYQLLLESAQGKSAAADAGGLAAFLAQQRALRLVFLNGCSTQQQAQGLLDANVSTVIATSRAIDDQVATSFATQFYQGLAGGASIQIAYQEASAARQTAQGSNPRGLYFGNPSDVTSLPAADRWPWNLYLRDGSESASRWNLPQAVDDPLFGLPPLPSQDLPVSPYRHLHRFRREDAEIFFGRGHQIRQLYDLLTATRSAPVVLFYGQSGVGKSSLLDAGLIPRVEGNYEVRYLRRTEGGLLDTLGLAFLPEAADEPRENAWRVKEQRCRKPLLVILDQVEECFTNLLADSPNELDQLLQFVQDTFRDPLRRPQGKLVLGFRKEWLAELEAKLTQYELPRTRVFLESLDRRGIVEAVRGPTRSDRLRGQYGLTIDDHLAESIADDLLADADSAIAPTLQILLTEMWVKATAQNYERPHFRQELYQQLRREGILLRDFLLKQIGAIRQREAAAVDSGLVLDILAEHTTPLGTAGQCSLAQLHDQYSHVGETLPNLLQRCQDLYLLTVAANPRKENEKSTRLAHDTLAPLVREQFEESDLPGQRARRVLDARAPDWEAGQAGDPLDSVDLKTVEEGAAGTRRWNEDETRLIAASRAARLIRQTLKRRARLLAGIALATIFAVAAIALFSWQAAEKNRLLAQGNAELRAVERRERLAQQIISEMNHGVAERDQFGNWSKAVHHFTKAAEIGREKQSDAALREPKDQAAIGNARLAAQLLFRGTRLVQILDLELPAIGKSSTELLPTHTMSDRSEQCLLVWAASVKPTTLAPGYLQVWNLDTGEPRISRLKVPYLLTAGINPAGTLVYTIDRRQKLVLYSIPDTFGPAIERASYTPVRAAQFAPTRNGSRLTMLQENGIASRQLADSEWNDASANPAPSMKEWKYPEHTNVFGFGIDRGVINACGAQSAENDQPQVSCVFQNLFSDSYLPSDDTGKEAVPAPSLPGTKKLAKYYPQSEFCSDGKAILFSDYEGSAILVDVASGREHTFSLQRGDSICYSAASRRLFRWSVDGMTNFLSDADTGSGARAISLPISNIRSATFSPDGKYLATLAENAAVVWDAQDGQRLTAPLRHGEGVRDIRFLTKRGCIATSAEDGTVRIWEFTPTPHKPSPRSASEDFAAGRSDQLDRDAVLAKLPSLINSNVTGGSLNSDGDRLVTWGSDGNARVWNLASNEPISPVMRHRLDIGGTDRALIVNGARFIRDDAIVVTWTGLVMLRLGEPTYANPGFVKLWDANTGLPLSTSFRYDLPVKNLIFDEQQQVLISPGPLSDGGSERLEIRQSLPADTALPQDQLPEYFEVATGTRINAFGEFEFLDRDEWLAAKRKLPD